MAEQPLTRAQRNWRRFCRLAVAVFYRRCEVVGLEHLPADGPVVLCANHANALVDAVIVQAACPRPIHPLARSGLFRRPWLRPLLRAIQAVPIYRRQPASTGETETEAEAEIESGADRNADTFRRCFEYLAAGRALLIFPEGQSHSDPKLRPIKTGAARLALGSHERTGTMPPVVPVGLTFTHKGRFRSRVLVQLGPPLELAPPAPGEDPWPAVLTGTERIAGAMMAVVLDVDSWQDLALMRQIQRFTEMRERVRPTGADSLHQRYRAFRRILEAYRWLSLAVPDEVAALRRKLERFQRLCRRYGVQDYHLHLRYRPLVVLRFLVRGLIFATLVFPLALWGVLNAALPYLATRWMSRRSARGRDQYDTASMLFGLFFFALFWGLQTAAVAWRFGLWPAAAAYAASLAIAAAVALKVGRERRRIVENVRVFLLFARKRKVRAYLRAKREELETDLARMTRLARRGPQAAPEVPESARS